MKTLGCWIVLFLMFALPGCRTPAATRADAERVAQDTVKRTWQHEVGVDSVHELGDTTIVWVSPRQWMATDAPQAGVRVGPDGRVVSVHWVPGG